MKKKKIALLLPALAIITASAQAQTVVTSGYVTSVGAGTVTLNGGGLLAGNDTTFTVNNNIVLGTNGGLFRSYAYYTSGFLGMDKHQDGILVINGSVSGSGGATFEDGGQMRFNGSNSYTGNTTFNGGSGGASVDIGNVNAFSGSTVVLSGFQSLNFSVAGNNTYNFGGISGSQNLDIGANTLSVGANNQNSSYSGNLSGSGGLVKTGSGTQTLSGANNFTGGTVINAGTLALGSANRLADSGSLIVNAGTFNLGGFSETVGAVTLAGGTITNGTLTGSAYDFRSGYISASLAGSAGITKTTADTVLLSGANTYTGTTTVGGGVLEFYNTNSLYNATASNWTGNKITVSNGATMAFAVGGAGQFSTSTITTLLTNGVLITSGNGFLSNSSIGFDVAGGNFTLTNNLNNSVNGSLGLLTYGGNTLTLTGTNSYTGITTINSGTTLQVGNGGTTGTLGSGSVTNNGTLSFNRSVSAAVSNVISGSGSLIQSGSGTTALAANNTYTGTTTISSGTLQVGNGSTNGSLGSGSLVNNGTLAYNRSDSLTLSGNMSGNGSLAQRGTGTITIAQTNLYGGSTLINSGTLALGIADALGSGSVIVNGGKLNLGSWNSSAGIVTLGNGTISGSGTLSGSGYSFTNGLVSASLGGNGNLIQGGGTTTLTGNNSYSGTTTISSGTLQVGNGGTSGTLGSGSITDNATLAFNRSDAVTVSNAISGIGNLTQAGNGTLILTANNSYNTTTISGGSLQVGNGSTNGSLGSGNVILNGTLAYNRSDSVTLSKSINGTGALVQNGTGTLILATNNGIGGGITVNAGTLKGSADNALGPYSPNWYTTAYSAVSVNNGATLDLGGFSNSVGAITMGSGTIANGTLNAQKSYGALTAESGLISASVQAYGFSKTGSGTLQLSGSNDFNNYGSSVVHGGTLLLNTGATMYRSASGDLTVGQSNGESAQIIINGGNVNGTNSIGIHSATLGDQAGSTGSVVINSGSWDNAWEFYVGKNGTGSLTVNGGSVSTGFGVTAGYGSNSMGSIQINGGNVTVGTSLYAGYGANSTGSIQINGGNVNATWIDIGYGGNATGSMTMTGGSLYSAAYIQLGNYYNGSSTGTMTVSGQSTLTAAAFNIYNGTLNVGNGSNSGSISISKIYNYGAGTATVNFSQTNALTLNTYLDGRINLNQSGTGTTTLKGYGNSLSGNTAVTAGTLATARSDALGSSTVTLNGGRLALLSSLSVSSLIWNSSSVISISSPGSMYLAVTGPLSLTGGLVHDFDLSGALVLTTPLKIMSYGTNSVSLSNFGVLGTNNYVLSLSNNALWVIRNAPTTYLTNGGTNTISGATNATNLVVGNGTGGNTVNLTTNTTVTVNEVLALGSGNSSTNTVNVSGGSLTVTNALVVGDSGSSNSLIISNGGSVNVNSGGGSSYIGFQSNSSNNSIVISGTNSSLGATTLTIGAAGSGNSLTVSNAGSLSSAGLILGASSESSSNSLTVTAGGTVSNTGTVIVGDNGSGNSLSVSNGGSVVTASTIVANGSSSSNNSVTVSGAGSLLSNSASVIVGNVGSGNTLVVSNGGSVVSATGTVGAAATSSNNSVLITGTGSSWSNSGTLYVGGDTNAGNSGQGTLTVTDGGTVSASAIVLASQTGSAGTLNVGTYGANGDAGTFSAPSVVFGQGSGTLNFNQGNATTFSPALSGSGSVNQLGTGTTILSGDNSGFTGSIAIENGSLQAGSLAALGNNASVSLANTAGATLNLNGYNNSIGSLSGGGSTGGNVTLGSGTITIGGNNINSTYTGTISGNGGLTMSGTGTQTLSGSNSYTGTTAVSSGTLQISSTGTITSTTTSIQSGGTLVNNGSVAGTTTVQSGGTLAGNGGSFNNLTLNGGSALKWNISDASGTAGTGWDLLNANNIDLSTLSSTNQLTINILGAPVNFLAQDYTFQFFNVTGLTTGFDFNNFVIDASGLTLDPSTTGGTWSVVQLNSPTAGLALTYTVPEPSTYVLLGLGALALVIAYRRSRT